MSLKQEIFAAQTKLATFSINKGFSRTGGVLTKTEVTETEGYVSALLDKAPQIMRREYLNDNNYSQEKLQETYIEFNKIIDNYLEVIFNVAQRIYRINPKVSLDDYNEFIRLPKTRVKPGLNHQNLSKKVQKAMKAYKTFTDSLKKENCSVLHIIKTGVFLDKKKINLNSVFSIMELLLEEDDPTAKTDDRNQRAEISDEADLDSIMIELISGLFRGMS